METFLVIIRNAAIIVVAITLFAGIGVAIGTFFSDNSHETY